MFSGIIEEKGKVYSILNSGGAKISVECSSRFNDTSIGDSVCVDGVCLTVVEKNMMEGGRTILSFDLAEETLRKTSFHMKKCDDEVNLERSLKLEERLHGHLVSGHVDCVGVLQSHEEENGSSKLSFSLPKSLGKYIVPKGSITISGVSLTVGEVSEELFCVYIIPHTSHVTTLGALQAGDTVNIEIDMIARYVEKILLSERIS